MDKGQLHLELIKNSETIEAIEGHMKTGGYTHEHLLRMALEQLKLDNQVMVDIFNQLDQ
jgi:hypothetical protein